MRAALPVALSALLSVAGCVGPAEPLDRFADEANRRAFLAACAAPPERSFTMLRALLAERPENLLVAWRLADLGRRPDLAARVRPLLKALPGPHGPTALARLERDPVKRIALAREALKLDPDHYPALYLRGRAHLERGEADKAVRYLERARALQPKWALPVFELAQARRMEGRTATAILLLGEYLERRPDDQEARLLMGNLLIKESGRTSETRRTVRVLKQALPGDWRVAMLDATYMVVKKRYRQAEAVYKRLLEDPEARAPAAYNLGVLRLTHLGDKAGALDAFRRYLATPPGGGVADWAERQRARLHVLELSGR